MIDKLTPEQEAKCPEYVKKWCDIGFDTRPTDMISAVDVIKRVYKVAGSDVPSYFIGPVDGPYEAAVVEALLNEHAKKKTEFKNASDLNDRILAELSEFLKNPQKMNLNIGNQIYGYQEYWISYYDFFRKECGLDLSIVQPLNDLAKVCGWWTPLADVAIIQHRASEIHRDDQGRLHNENGPAVKFGSGDESLSNVYAVHGVRVPKNVIDRNYNVEDIENQSNAEVRRVMIDLYGQSKYLLDSGAEVVHTDDFGTLYRKEIPNDEPLMMVKVVNSTIEPDGSQKDYWLRVDPNTYGGLKTARAAVASTWRNNDANRSLLFKSPDDYDPDIETWLNTDTISGSCGGRLFFN